MRKADQTESLNDHMIECHQNKNKIKENEENIEFEKFFLNKQ